MTEEEAQELEFDAAFTVGGVRFSVHSLDELSTAVAASPAMFKAVKSIEQAALAQGVFKKEPGVNADPVKAVSTGPGDVPSCKHGTMNDVRGKVYKGGKNKGQPYPKNFYCPADFDAPDRCDARD